MASGPITSWQIDEETVRDFIFLGSKITADDDWSHEIKRCLFLGRKAMTNLDSILKSRDITNKGPSSHSYGSSCSHVWELFSHKESWAPKNWCFWTVVLEKTLESPLDCKEIQPIHPKGNHFTARTDVEAETPILWPPDVKNWLIWKDSDAGKDWGREEKGTTEDEMAGWHHRRNGHEFEWTLGVGDGQGGLACCSSWVLRVRHDWATELNWIINGCWILWKVFSASIEMIICFLSFNLLIWCISLIDFYILKNLMIMMYKLFAALLNSVW